MAILIDPPAWPAHGRLWSHLVSDSDLEELHAFAARVGAPRRGFDGDHYDIPQEWYDAVVAAGAEPTDTKELLSRLKRSGLRLGKRKGEWGVVKVRDVVFPDGATADVDLIASTRHADEARTFAAVTLVSDSAGDLAVVHSVRRRQWGPPGGWRDSGESVLRNAVREIEEETGLLLPEESLRPIGYERFKPTGDSPLWRPGQDLIQAYAVRLESRRPDLTATDAGTSDRRWVDPEEFAKLCSGQYWWPLYEFVSARA